MAWRHLMISNPVELSTEDKNLLIKKDGEKLKIPLEDISTIMLDNTQCNLTGKLLEKMCSYNILLYVCDEKHLPEGIFFPFGRHSRQLKILKSQIEMTEPFKKRVWQKIVKQKLINQGKVLEMLKIDNSKYLENISARVESGDKNNDESVGANYYFSKLFDREFTRRDENNINGALNYGYAIIRGAIIRRLSVYGYACSLGIFHRSELNEFNLGDDMIECFRPVVDLWVMENLNTLGENLSTQNKMQLLNLLNCNVKLRGKYYSVDTAIEEVIKTFTNSINNNEYENFLLPEIVKLKNHEYE